MAHYQKNRIDAGSAYGLAAKLPAVTDYITYGVDAGGGVLKSSKVITAHSAIDG
jgi:hypothetical protein